MAQLSHSWDSTQTKWNQFAKYLFDLPILTVAQCTIAKTWNQPMCVSAESCVNQVWYVCIVECYAALKRRMKPSLLQRNDCNWKQLYLVIEPSLKKTNTMFSDMWQFIQNEKKCIGMRWMLWGVTAVLARVHTPVELVFLIFIWRSCDQWHIQLMMQSGWKSCLQKLVERGGRQGQKGVGSMSDV